MNDLNKLVFAAKKKLDKTSNSSGFIGNRMHFPMLINYYGERVATVLDRMTGAFDRIWPQTSENIIYVHSSLSKENNRVLMSELSRNDNQIMLENVKLQNMIDGIRLKKGTFVSMLKWCIFNIVDTSSITDLTAFETVYNHINVMNDIFDGTTLTMLIVLLDESSSKRDIAISIREYLSKSCTYNGVIVISNKTIKNELYEFDELIDIIPSVIILSNNDMIPSHDDNYNRRSACLFGGCTYTMAYSSLKRPNEKISTQILYEIIEQIYKNQINRTISLSENDLCRKFGFENGKIPFIEEQLKSINVCFPENDIVMLPLRKIPTSTIDINSITYSAYSKYLYEGVFESYIDSYLRSLENKTINIESLLCEYLRIIKNRIAASEIISLSDGTIKNLMNRLQLQSPDKELTLPAYFEKYVKYYIRKNIVIPYVQKSLLELSLQARNTIDSFCQFREDFRRVLPLDGFSELGTMYVNLTNNYIQTTVGENVLCKVTCPGNGYDEFARLLLQAIDNIIDINKDVFSLSFIVEWEKRLNLAGDKVYRLIQSTFERDFEQKLFLFGNYQRNKISLEVYMCHTTDLTGQKFTDLYRHLRDAVGGLERTQFVNTGFDDVVEAFRFIDCSGNNILL